jgi:UDP-glucose 4-epimerase
MKVLVTGGAGFIGSHIVDSYLENGLEVVIVDNFFTGKRENINPEAKFYNMDICSLELKKIFEKEKPDFVNHHAAQIDVRKSVNEPYFDAKVNIMGTLNILKNSLKYKVKKLIFASSGGVIYGEVKDEPANENFLSCPISPYGISKLAGEEYIKFYGREFGLNYTILRYGNVYGPRQDPFGEAGVVAIFTNKMLKGETPIIYGDGRQIRDYVYVKDVVKANLLALEKGNNEIINIGTSIPTTVDELYHELKEIIKFKGKSEYAEERKGELKRSLLDRKKAKDILRWKPAYSLKQGLKETFEYFRT